MKQRPFYFTKVEEEKLKGLTLRFKLLHNLLPLEIRVIRMYTTSVFHDRVKEGKKADKYERF